MTDADEMIAPSSPRKFTGIFTNHWQRWFLAGISTVVFLLGVLILPFLVERHDSRSFDWETRHEGEVIDEGTSNVYPRFEQFSVDTNSFLRTTRDFPHSMAVDPTIAISYRNRPLYPAVSAIIPRIVTIIIEWPDLREAISKPMSLRLTFISMLFSNFVIALGGTQIFYSWLLHRFNPRVSLIAATLFAVSDRWLFAAPVLTTTGSGFAILAVILYVYDTRLLSEEEPSWRQIISTGLIAGLLMLGKTQYDVLMVCWLWSIALRRWRPLLGTIAVFMVPTLIWIGILALFGIEYYNFDFQDYRFGVWPFDMIRDGQFFSIYPAVSSELGDFMGGLFSTFPITVTAAVVWAFYAAREQLPDQWITRFVLGIVAIASFSILVRGAGGGNRWAFDAYYLILPTAGIGLVALVDQVFADEARPVRSRTLALVSIVVFVVLSALLRWIARIDNYVWNPALNELSSLFSRFNDLFALTGPEY